MAVGEAWAIFFVVTGPCEPGDMSHMSNGVEVVGCAVPVMSALA